MNKKFLPMLIFVTLLTPIAVFQNACSPGFKMSRNLGTVADFASMNFDPVVVAKGEALYSTNCSGCHSAITATTVPSFNSEAIMTAVMTKPSMAGLKGVINLEMAQAISMALQKNRFDSSGGSLFPPLQFACANPDQRGEANKNFRRLLKFELVNTLNDLLSPSVVSDSQIALELTQIKDDNLAKDFTSLAETHDSSYLRGLYNISKRAAQMVMSSAALKTQFLGACGSAADLTDDCMKTFIRNFGSRAYRRPLTQTQLDVLFSMYKSIQAKNTTNGSEIAAQGVMSRILTSPYLAYHYEMGSEVVGNRIRLTAYEVASRISYRLLGTMPDEALLTAAGNGELLTIQGVRKHVNRLAATPKAIEKANLFFSYYANLENIDPPNKFVAASVGVDVNQIEGEMKQEALDFAKNVVWTRSGTFFDLMTSSEVFPRSSRMAQILGTNVSQGGVSVRAANEHSGFFLRPALLASQAGRTDIIHRGLNFRKRFMCSLGKGKPPSDITSAAKGIDFDNLSNRDGISKMTGSGACVGCHMVFNPVGYLLEGHNQLGMTRTSEPIFDSTGKQIKTFPIDKAVTRSYIDRNSDNPISTAAEMVEKFGASDDAKACFAAKAFGFYNQKNYSAADDGCALAEVVSQIASGTVSSAIEQAIANEDIFWKGL